MTIRTIGTAFAGWFLLAASPVQTHPSTATTIGAEREIAAQVEMWNRGDLEAVLQTYCPNAEITWVSGTGISHGYERFAQSMREEFGSGRAAMGTLAIDVLESRDLAGGGSLVVVRWSIMRDGRRLMGGVSSQLWVQCAGRMRITFEHAS